MSAVIRLQLATVLATLKVKGRAVLTVLNATDTTVDEDDRLEADVVQLREAAGRAQVLVDTWSDMIARLMPTEQQDEMDILQAFPPPRGEVREDDEPTALAQIEHAYELVDLVNVCLQQRRNGGRGSVSSQRTGNSFMTTQSLQQLEEQPEYMLFHHNHSLRNMVVHCATLDQHTSQAVVQCSTTATDAKPVFWNRAGASTAYTMVTCSTNAVLPINAVDVEADTTSCCVHNVNRKSVCTTQMVTTMDRLKPIGDKLNQESVCTTNWPPQRTI
uniref:Uncharacterized protein n=1 Tax=Meloidogyne enterolobii TaxID=390850 RepID=A0A6V7Y013_MELEN|nr:unnamed protein product [Meloidogyne enterolobii]